VNDRVNKKMEKRPPKAAILIGVIVILCAGFKFYLDKSEFKYAGTLEATKVDLSAQLPSTLEAVKVIEGEHVSHDQMLVLLTCDDIKVASELADKNFERNRRLYQSGSVSQEIFDQMKNRKQDIDVRKSWCSIKSPIAATVLNRYHEPGEWVNPGTKLLTLANIKDIWATIYVPQPEVSKLKPGMRLIGALPELGGKVFEGRVLKINEEAEFTPKNVQTRAERTRLVFGVKVSFLGSNDAEILKPGMTIEIQFPKE